MLDIYSSDCAVVRSAETGLSVQPFQANWVSRQTLQVTGDNMLVISNELDGLAGRVSY